MEASEPFPLNNVRRRHVENLTGSDNRTMLFTRRGYHCLAQLAGLAFHNSLGIPERPGALPEARARTSRSKCRRVGISCMENGCEGCGTWGAWAAKVLASKGSATSIAAK